jgi:hypothetical protein
VDRLTVAEAADTLGITRDAVRKRVQRDNIPWEKDEDGRIWVYLDQSTTRARPVHDTVQDSSSGTRSGIVHDSVRDQLVEELREQNRFLRAELERKDAILMTMAQRIPELEPASEPRESPVSDSEASSKGEGGPADQDSLPWDRRIFGY